MRKMSEQIFSALDNFAQDYFKNRWIIREREAISFFVFGYLLPEIKAEDELYHPAQIGIEVHVPKLLVHYNTKNKDLIFWKKPFDVAYDRDNKTVNYPIVVMEWKDRLLSLDSKDKHWLVDYSRAVPSEFLGICLTINEDKIVGENITQGEVFRSWEICKNN